MKRLAPENIDAKVVTAPVLDQASGLVDTPAGSPLLKAAAFRNILANVVALERFQLETFWLNAVAPENIEASVVTEPVLDQARGFVEVPAGSPLLKAAAFKNMLAKVVADAGFQSPMYELNFDAPENMLANVVAAETFQVEMSWLKADAPENMDEKFVTFETFQGRGLEKLSIESPLLNAEALVNMLLISTALLVSHSDRS